MLGVNGFIGQISRPGSPGLAIRRTISVRPPGPVFGMPCATSSRPTGTRWRTRGRWSTT